MNGYAKSIKIEGMVLHFSPPSVAPAQDDRESERESVREGISYAYGEFIVGKFLGSGISV